MTREVTRQEVLNGELSDAEWKREIVAEVVQVVVNALPRVVEQAIEQRLAEEMQIVYAAREEALELYNGVRMATFDAVEAKALESVVEVVEGSYNLHLARCAAASGIGVAEYAKIAREMKEDAGQVGDTEGAGEG